MDVSDILAAQAAKQKAVTVEKEIPLEVDAGFLTVTDLNPIDAESYNEDVEDYLKATARDGVQALVSALFSLPTTSSPDGPLAKLPPPTTQLPRAKPLPKPKPPTKWEQFAKAKGIQKKRKEKKVWDEEKQEWVDRWGWKGSNKKEEQQWITEVPANADADHDPVKAARDARKTKVAKNERQHKQNVARAQGSNASSAAPANSERKKQIDRTLATTRASTASMGKFDKTLEGEKKLKGVKRKLDREPAMKKAKSAGGHDVLNVRKAIRSASKGKGSAALAREGGGGKMNKGI
ncbi:hypothetical protein EVJ58_g2441 [Rhodofomes roseus]|uniref:Ribosome biogenesis regulatory protein n=1 Tax=Rhodofomes roseus TaxID=34475 RepID=A0A4Y9YSG6_9APHY|nr:hypothetical protein EVJ58_g2441 [Rhodofomes roseus]